jgi:hypothetical protein
MGQCKNCGRFAPTKEGLCERCKFVKERIKSQKRLKKLLRL